MLLGMTEMLNAALTNLSNAVAVKNPPSSIAGNLPFAAHFLSSSTSGSIEVTKNIEI